MLVARAPNRAKRHRRTYSNSLVDLDDDGDLDLLVVSDFAGIDLYENDGHGRFTDITDRKIAQPHFFGMAHTFGDYDRDGLPRLSPQYMEKIRWCGNISDCHIVCCTGL